MGAFNSEEYTFNDAQKKKKKIVKISIIVCVVLIVLLVALIMYYKEVDARTFKLYVDGTQVSVSSDFYITDENGNIYVKAKDLANYIGWTYQNGEYGSYTEDSDSGYLQNDYEAASFVADSTTLKKYIVVSDTVLESEEETGITVNSENGTEETMELDLPVVLYNEQIYLPFENLSDICNCRVSYSSYRMSIEESDYLLQLCQSNAAAFGYSAVSGVYENIRALAYNMMIVQNSSGNYGVVTLSEGNDIIGFKYVDIVFSQNVKEFFVETSSGVGVVDVEGNVVISPGDYDSISILDNILGLYLIEKSNKYGVISREGDTIVYADYDSIGLSEEAQYVFENDENNNIYLIYDNTLVVEEDGKYGFYNLSGTNTLRVNYQGVGYITENDSSKYEQTTNSSSSKTSSTDTNTSTEEGDSVLTIDIEFNLDDGSTAQVKGIVVEQTGVTGETLYGVYDAMQERLIIPCACSRIYSISKNGTTTYYLEYNGESFEFTDYAKSHPDDNLYTVTNATTTNSSSIDIVEENSSDEEVEEETDEYQEDDDVIEVELEN